MINFIKFLEDGNVARLGVSDWLIFTVQSGLKHLAMPKLLGTTTQGGFLLILGNRCLRGWNLKRLVPSSPVLLSCKQWQKLDSQKYNNYTIKYIKIQLKIWGALNLVYEIREDLDKKVIIYLFSLSPTPFSLKQFWGKH